jgi:hypothetical protein
MTSRENERMGGLPIEVRDYAQLIRAIRSWIAELGTAGETIDDVAGLPLRYTMKLLAPVPVKGIGRTSLGPLLGALGLKLVVAVDHEQLERIRHRLIGRHHASIALLPVGKARQRAFIINSTEVAILYNERRTLKLSPTRRSSIARIAAKARWAKVRQSEAGRNAAV